VVVKKSEWENTQDSGANLLLFSAAPAILRALLKVCGEEGGGGEGGGETARDRERKKERGGSERACNREGKRERESERERDGKRENVREREWDSEGDIQSRRERAREREREGKKERKREKEIHIHPHKSVSILCRPYNLEGLTEGNETSWLIRHIYVCGRVGVWACGRVGVWVCLGGKKVSAAPNSGRKYTHWVDTHVFFLGAGMLGCVGGEVCLLSPTQL